MNILISGGSGFIGSAFSDWLQNHTDTPVQITWLTRDASQVHPQYVTMMTYDELQTSPLSFDVIINLAGTGIADARWSDERKKLLLDSRLKPTQALLDYMARIEVKPQLLVSGSAIGWYGAQGNKPLNESSSFEQDFAHDLCETWEQLALKATEYGVPVALVRTGIVIHPTGGMVGKLLTPFKMCVGGQLGDGEQIMSWISRTDWIRAAWFIIEKELSAASNNQAQADSKIYNLTAPNPITNATFTKAMGNWLHRPTLFTLPAPLLKLMFGEMSTLLVDGQKVLPTALLEAGFAFEHTTIQQALEQQ
ncbi:TIGR01777 family oxidoreductase [Psychrobacter arenosus]|uniref:TIGR01777 family oxidoreductase n=1 Tax=Psychrobacter arenosus TaxID=256326 RepID=UPI00191AF3C8|nr:TIGR01777 family oxidoreductase [Psychrobacter arenosus]